MLKIMLAQSTQAYLARQGEDVSWHVRSYGSIKAGSDFDGKPGRFGKENNFGKFGDHNINKDHRCSFSSASKTQHWFGAKYDE